MSDGRVKRLLELADVMRDHRLARLSAAVARRDAAVALREGLVAEAGADPLALQAQAAYHGWVEHRRAVLARQIDADNREVAALQDAARLAFGRAEVLRKLRDQLS